MSSTTSLSSTTGTSVSIEGSTQTPRLIDSDPAKFRSLKQVIVVGRPGCGTDAVGDALKKLGFKVYDFKTASDRHARDFALWLEAAQLRSKGEPYNRDDYDKIIGDHNALVSAPTCFFDHDFVKMYPTAKVIMITREPAAASVSNIMHKLDWFAKFKAVVDKVDSNYFTHVHQFLDIMCKNKLDHQTIRDTVRPHNLLELDELTDWKPLCDFLGIDIPTNAPVPRKHDNTTADELASHPVEALKGVVKDYSEKITTVFPHICIGAGITLTGRMLANYATPKQASIAVGVFAVVAAHYYTKHQPSAPRQAEYCVPSEAASSVLLTSTGSSTSSALNACAVPFPFAPPTAISQPPHLRSKSIESTSSKSSRQSGDCRSSTRRGHKSNRSVTGRVAHNSKPPASSARITRPVRAEGCWANFEDTIAQRDQVDYDDAREKCKENEGKEVVITEVYIKK